MVSQQLDQKSNFIDRLANVLYSQENVERANDYVRTRNLNHSKFRFPWVYTSSDPTNYFQFKDFYAPEIFTDCLFIPITAINNPNYLVGFDVRYLGTREYRLRYVKLKRTPDTLMMYSTHIFASIEPGQPLLITEGAMDAESLRGLGYPVVSPLTAQSKLRFLVFLRAISTNIYFIYDNDESGRKATQKVMKQISIDSELQRGFTPLIYSGKDPNWILMNYGEDYIQTVMGVQIS